MDNAAKALLIAGGILLSIIVLSLFMLMLNSLTEYQQAQTQIEKNQDIVTFNNQYAGYLRDGISGYDIVSIINKVKFYNNTQPDEKINLKVNFNGLQNRFAKESATSKLFTESINQNGIDIINEILDTKMPNYPDDKALAEQYKNRTQESKYTEDILQGLLDNKDSTENLFVDYLEFRSLSLDNKIKRFKKFNLIVGQVFFPLVKADNSQISNSVINYWQKKYFSADADIKDGRGKTIKEELEYYAEYKQFQRGIFNYKVNDRKETYSSKSGRIVYMEFEFTGEFI